LKSLAAQAACGFDARLRQYLIFIYIIINFIINSFIAYNRSTFFGKMKIKQGRKAILSMAGRVGFCNKVSTMYSMKYVK
ncbi:MAG TPA: hypothetical protein PLG94_11405, partial [Smithellaceae bacterium]|nr:hypothetical protein [Smithellaceae bacterium]